MKVSGATIIAGIVAIFAVIAATLLGLAVTGHLDANSTPLITVVLGLAATTITSLVAAIKVDAIAHDLRNGLIEQKVANVVQPIVTEAHDSTISAITGEEGNNHG